MNVKQLMRLWKIFALLVVDISEESYQNPQSGKVERGRMDSKLGDFFKKEKR